MKKNIIISLFLLIIFFAALQADASYQIRGNTKYLLEIEVFLENSSNEDVECYLMYPAVQSFPPFQTVDFISCNRKPEKVESDEWGNKIESFTVKIPPKKTDKLKYVYNVSVNSLYFDIMQPTALDNKEEFKKYISPQQYIEADNPEIIKTAKEIASSENNNLYKTIKIYDYLRGLKFINKKPTGALDALLSKTVQCCDANLLMMALFRSLEVPCEYVGGIYVLPGRETFEETHAWTLVYLGEENGWIPIDPTAGRTNEYFRLRSFSELSSSYITTWRGRRDPFYYVVNKGDPFYIKVNYRANIKKLNEYFYTNQNNLSEFNNFNNKASDILTLAKISNYERQKKLNGFTLFDIDNMWNVRKETAVSIKNMEKIYKEAVILKNKNIALAFDKFMLSRFAFYFCMESHYGYIESAMKMGLKDKVFNEYLFLSWLFPQDPYFKYFLGLNYLHQNCYTDALANFNSCSMMGLDNAYLYNSYGVLCFLTKQMPLGEKYFLLAISKDPDFIGSYLNLLYLYQVTTEREKLLYLCKRAVIKFPNENFFYTEYGYQSLQAGSANNALSYLQKAVKIDPELGWAHALLGWAYSELNMPSEARTELRLALKLKSGIEDPFFYENLLNSLPK